jgi:hypothetical protein
MLRGEPFEERIRVLGTATKLASASTSSRGCSNGPACRRL